MGVQIKDAIDFREVCSSVKRMITDLQLSFVCKEFYNHFMWLGDKDFIIGYDICHYEMRLADVDEETMSYEEDELEDGEVQVENKIIGIQENDNVNEFNKNIGSSSKEKCIIVEIHLEGGSNELKQNLINYFKDKNEFNRMHSDYKGNYWYRRKNYMKFPLKNDNANIKAIIAELLFIHEKYGKELIKLILPYVNNDSIII